MFHMFESVQFHLKDHLLNSMCNLLKQIGSLCWIGHNIVLNHFLPKRSLNQLFSQLLKQDETTTESAWELLNQRGSLVESRLNKLLDQ